MRVVKTIWDWLVRNLGNVFSILGVFLTLYFGVYYVPSYLRESQNEQLKNAQSEIQQSVKELVFSDSTFNTAELTSLVHAKEISLGEKFPLSLTDILTKAEESFMEDRYLPLIKRRSLIQKIEEVKQQLPKETSTTTDKQKAEDNGFIWVEWLSILGSILAVIVGLISFFMKYQLDKDKEEEIKNEIQDIIPPKEATNYAIEFEKKIEDILQKRSGIKLLTEEPNRGIDFEFDYNNKKYFVEVKFLTRSKVGLNTFHQLTYFLQDKKGEAWLIYNTDLTALVSKEIENFNQKNMNIKLKSIRVTSAKDFADKLDEFLKT
ncbi:MAG: hypothetical protein WC760_11350 [Bacteroidia bacterium]|jgi:hypothetical protein